MLVLKRVILIFMLYFVRPSEKFDNRFDLSKYINNPIPALYTSSFDRKCKFALVSRWSAGPD